MSNTSAQKSQECRLQLELSPVSGKAVPMTEGEVLRISQVSGEQCVDFNAFSLDDYKEHMSAGHSRRQGFHLGEGHVLLSNRMRPLFAIVRMSQDCVTDLLAARCNAPLFELKYGTKSHTNCQDTLAVAIAEFGLTPDDVHDSFNIWMNTVWDSNGRMWSEWNSARHGDNIELLACRDVLAVPVVCGSGDLTRTSSFFLRPIKVEVLEATDESREQARTVRGRHWSEMAELRASEATSTPVLSNRALRPIENYVPQFLRFPLRRHPVRLRITQAVFDKLEEMVSIGDAIDVADAIRKVAMSWYLDHELLDESVGNRRGGGRAARK